MLAHLLPPNTLWSRTIRAWRFVTAHQGRPGAETALDAALRLDTQVMLVDDPVKRVDTMTMAWGLEARVPFLDHDFVELAAACPARAETGVRRQGRAQGRVAGAAARRGDRPHQGVLPGAGHPSPARRDMDMVRDALTNDAARTRGLYRGRRWTGCLRRPTRPEPHWASNTLWQLAVLEMWLQSMEGR